MKRFFSLYVLLLLFIAVAPSKANADFRLLDSIEEFGEKRYVRQTPGRLEAGPLKIHPTLRTSVTFDDNILLEDIDGRDDIIFNIQPGVILELPIDTHQIAVGYEADFEVFSKSRHSNQNDQNQNMFALIDLNFPSWYINVLENFSETSSRAGTTFTTRIPRFDQSIHPKIGVRWKRFTFEAAFRHFYRDYRRQVNDNLDFQEVTWSGVIYYDLFARLKTLLEYQVSQIDYDDAQSRQGTFQQIRVGFEGRPFPNLKTKVSVGPQFRNYHESSEQDFNSWVADLEVDYLVRDNLKLELAFSREAIEATFQNVNFYKQYRVELGFEYYIRPQWTLSSSVAYSHNKYEEPATLGGLTDFRKDHKLLLNAGLKYDFRDWLEMQIEYEYLRRNSNFSALDYTDHRVILSTALSY